MSMLARDRHKYVPEKVSLNDHHRIVEAGFHLRMGKIAQDLASFINGHFSSDRVFPSQFSASLKRGDLCSSNE